MDALGVAGRCGDWRGASGCGSRRRRFYVYDGDRRRGVDVVPAELGGRWKLPARMSVCGAHAFDDQPALAGAPSYSELVVSVGFRLVLREDAATLYCSATGAGGPRFGALGEPAWQLFPGSGNRAGLWTWGDIKAL